MISPSIFSVSASAIILAGCTTMSSGTWNNLHEKMRDSPQTRHRLIADCIARQRGLNSHQKVAHAKLVNRNVANYAPTYCRRFLGGIASGRITYDDYLKLDSPNADHSKVLKLMAGR
ncbi:hypothetical protein [Mesorhizobium tianshanense]|uniref:Uncharacterized protein n=1 Tax=Mesorhizobium tianshanense TaxID=39844 RepID=A0A562NHJ4_9HYPH|nr:hypothetical protein [Mesorhizobium tianshanense]TWI31659.1 hypothetical protein IQ26_04465 [Mesorhizobium tianshanense]